MEPMRGHLIKEDGSAFAATPQDVAAALAGSAFFWLDLTDFDQDVSDLLLRDFGFHPLAVEDAEHGGQRPKLDDYESFTYLVVHGASSDGQDGGSGTVEVHLFYTPRRVVTVHRGEPALLDPARERLGRHQGMSGAPPAISVLYLVVDTLVDSYFPVLSRFDDRIDELEDAILRQPTEAQLGELFEMKQELVRFRKVVAPQRDMFAGLASGVRAIEGVRPEDLRYFRDLYDHLIRISDLVDSYRDLLAGAMDTHISMVSNRLNVVMKQLTVIATVFLPLSFITGFFGQNFAFLTGNVLTQSWSFWALGIGLEVVTVWSLLALFRRRGWLGGPTA